jgi:hypothetical protein
MNPLVRRFQAPVFAALIAVSLVALAGCGPSYGSYPATALEVNERILRVRGALNKVRNDPFADEVPLDLQRAESWIVTAETEVKKGKPDERADLYLTTVEGQISMIQTRFAQRRAEEKLAKHKAQAFAPAEPTSE